MWPSRVEATKPPSTGTCPAATAAPTVALSAALVSSASGRADMWSSVVMMARRASTHAPGSPACTMAAATSLELRSSPTAATTSDMLGDSSRSSTSVRTTATSWSHCSLIWRFERGVARRQVPRRRQVALANLRDACQRLVGFGGGGVGRHFEQAVGDAAHGGHHDGRAGAVAGARSTDDFDEAADGIGVGHRRAAEFLYDHWMRGGPAETGTNPCL